MFPAGTRRSYGRPARRTRRTALARVRPGRADGAARVRGTKRATDRLVTCPWPGCCRAGYCRPLLMALTSSPLPVSPLNSQKKAPPRPWFLAQLIFPAMVDGVSYDHQLLPQ